MADLNQLFQNLGPGTAALWAGQSERASQEQELLQNAKLAQAIEAAKQEQQYNQQLNPLKLEQQRLLNQGSQAQIPGISAQSDLARLTAQQKAGTIGSDINAANSKNETSISEDQAKKMNKFGDFFTKAGTFLTQVPDAPGARESALKSYLESAGLKIDSKEGQMFSQVLQNIPSAKLPDALSMLGSKLIEQGAGYKQTMDVAKLNKDAQERIAKGNNATQIQVANIQAASKQAVAAAKSKASDIISQVQSGKLTAEKAAVAFKVMSEYEQDPDIKQNLQVLSSQMEQFAMNQKNAGAGGKPDLNSLGVPTQQLPPALNQPTAPQRASSGKPQSISDLQKLYPGVPPQKLKEAYKKKFGVDLQ